MTKIQDRQEVLKWFAEGRTYSWMVEKYIEKYNIETTQTMWANFRSRNKLPRRIARNETLIPWGVKEEHRYNQAVVMLRQEARRREGLPLTEGYEARVNSWLEMLEEEGVVVHYDPDTEEGFFYVPREAGDDDIIRRPPEITRARGTA
jgi:hypothetical protein